MHKVWVYKRSNKPNSIFVGWYEGAKQKTKCFPIDHPEWADRYAALKTAQLNSDLQIFRASDFTAGWQMLTDEYVKRKKVDGLTEAGIYQIKNTLAQFEAITSCLNSGQLTQQVLDSFILERQKTVTKATLNKDIRNLKAFIAWLSENKYCSNGIKIKQFRLPKKATPPLTLAQIKNVLIAADKFEGWRMRCLLALSTGLRAIDIDHLTVGSINFESYSIATESQKTGKAMAQRPIPADLIPTLTDYVSKLPEGTIKLCPGHHTARIWIKIRRQAGLDKLKFHDWRKQFGSELAQAGANQKVVQDLLEHSSATVTDIYTNLPDKTKIDAVNKLPVKDWI